MINELISAFMSKIVSDGIDCTKDAIKEALKQKAKGHNTLDIQMYNVIIETIKDIASLEIKKDEKNIYDAAEVFLKSAGNKNQEISYKIKMCLNCLWTNPDENDCEQFKKKFRARIAKKENEELYKALKWERGEQGYEKLSKIEYDVNEIKHCFANAALNSKQQNKFQNNKKKIYCDIWNRSLFLQHKDSGILVRLCDAFVEPHYDIYQFDFKDNLDDILGHSQSLEEFIDSFINFQEKKTMLMTGVPGIGKSTIVAKLAYKYKNNDSVIILRFRDWEQEELEGGILKAIKKTLECNKMDLEHKILIIDGLDEIKLLKKREELIQGFFNDISDYAFLKCIITSRPHYIQTENFNICIELVPFDMEKIRTFYTKIKGEKLNGTISEESIGVYGIPVILYMSIMCNFDITKHSSKPHIYNRIFAKNGGIFDRFSSDGKAFSEGAQILRDAKNIEKYLAFLRETAFKVFKLNGDDLELQDCDIPTLKFEQKKIKILEFPLKPLFENIEKIEFIHRSIYEYFVSEYIFACLSSAIKGAREELAEILGTILKDNSLSPEILEFLQYRIRSSALNEKFETVLDTFQMMLQDGMTYYVSERCKTVIACEKNVFCNMLELLHLWDINSIKLDKSIRTYLFFKYEEKYNVLKKRGLARVGLSKINLAGLKLNHVNSRGIDLRGVDLNGVNLSRASLRGVDLSISDLSGSDLSGIDLSGSDLSGSDLSESDLKGADLSGIDLSAADLSKTDLKGADLSGANLTHTDLIGANLEGSDLRGIDLIGADLSGADLMKVDLRDANIKFVDLRMVNLEEANLSGVDLRKTDLIGVILSGANLSGANLSGVDLRGVNLIGADLSGANLRGVNLRGVDLRGANLNGANLSEADLSEANLSEANLSEVDFNMTIFDENQIEYLERDYNLQGTRTYFAGMVIGYEKYSIIRRFESMTKFQ